MVSGCAWQRRGGGIPAPRSLVVDKGKVGVVLDKAGCGVGLTGDDQNLAAPSGHHHAEIGMVQSMPEQALWRLSPLGAQN